MPGRNAKPRNKCQTETRERALSAVATARREKISISAAAVREGTTVEAVRRYAPSTLRQKKPRGRIQVTPHDRIARTLNFLTPQGDVAITLRGSRIASRIGVYKNAVKLYRNEGDTSALKEFAGKSIRTGGVTYPFITDTAVLDKLAHAGLLAVEGLYRSV
jgi:hypothetical protein